MNLDDYCQQKAAPAGSGAYYALRQAPRAIQPLLLGLYAFRRELDDAVKKVSDPSVAHAKLAWWRDEIARLDGGSPSHPVSQVLAAYRDNPAVQRDLLLGLVDGFALDLDAARYPDFAGLRHYLDQVGGGFVTLLALATGGAPSALPAWAPALGRGLALTDIVQNVGADARLGRIYIPIDEMQRFGVTAANITHRTYSDAFSALMKFQADRARVQLGTAFNALPTAEARRQRALRAELALARAILDEIEADSFQILHQRIALTPIRKLWLAWRAARGI